MGTHNNNSTNKSAYTIIIIIRGKASQIAEYEQLIL